MIFHIDMSRLYDQSSYSVISLVSVDNHHSNNHKIEKVIIIPDNKTYTNKLENFLKKL